MAKRERERERERTKVVFSLNSPLFDHTKVNLFPGVWKRVRGREKERKKEKGK